MIRQFALLPGAALCLSLTAGCTVDDAETALLDAPTEERQLERDWQNIEVYVRASSGNYRFEVNGQCGFDGQSLYAEGTSKNAEFSVHVSKDASSGLSVLFSTRDDEWEVILDPADDTSEIDEKNIFTFRGDVPRNHDESNLEPLEVVLLCTGL